MTAAQPLLQVRGLAIRSKGATTNLVDGVDLSVMPGETLCIVGESGSGKSLTALSLLGLLAKPALEVVGGTAVFEGRDLFALAPAELSKLRGDRIAMIFQEPMSALNPSIRIGEQIAEGVRRHRDVSHAAARDRALEMLRRVRIPAPERRLDDFPHQLSGGMRQRAMIAMALANDPVLLIADEPTTALDVTIQAQILDLMRSLKEEAGTALILITHDLGVVAEMADRIAVMYAGRIVEAGPTAEVFGNPQHPYTIGLMTSMPAFGQASERLVTIPGIVPSISAMPSGCRFSTRCPFRVAACAKVPPLIADARGHATACFRAPLEDHVPRAAE
ncbi:MAG: ABC transporter ATP-binding protein [Paracoccaceae bacterium]|nr:ABC transporter ATP-binding protein [Paracoccaceae bacterium]